MAADCLFTASPTHLSYTIPSLRCIIYEEDSKEKILVQGPRPNPLKYKIFDQFCSYDVGVTRLFYNLGTYIMLLDTHSAVKRERYSIYLGTTYLVPYEGTK